MTRKRHKDKDRAGQGPVSVAAPAAARSEDAREAPSALPRSVVWDPAGQASSSASNSSNSKEGWCHCSSPLVVLFALSAVLLPVLLIGVVWLSSSPAVVHSLSPQSQRDEQVMRFLLNKDKPCCYTRDSFEIRELPYDLGVRAIDNKEATAVRLTDYPRPFSPPQTSLSVMSRSDGEAFHVEFNSVIDKLALNSEEYNEGERMWYVSGASLLGVEPLVSFKGAMNTVGCAALNLPPNDRFVAGVCAMAPGTSFQWRTSFGDTVLRVEGGEAKIMVTRPSNLEMLMVFPVVHALQHQSQLSSKVYAGHPAFMSDPYDDLGHRIPCNNFTLTPGEALLLPPFWGHKVTAYHSTRNTVVVFEYSKKGRIINAVVQALKFLPPALYSGAMKGKPMFLALWNLEMFFDELFGFRSTAERRGSALEKVLKWRWKNRVLRGHVDDPRDVRPNKHAILQLQSAIRRECEDWKVTHKEMQMGDRAQYIDAAVEAAGKINDLFVKQGKLPDQAIRAMKLEVFERAVGDTVGIPGLPVFFDCMFDNFA